METFARVSEETLVLNLSRLHLADLNLEHITEPQRKKIQELHLTYNSLAFFPTPLYMFSSLEFLDMSNNALTVFPEDILQLTKLKTLVAKNNQLDEASFPKRFGSMPIETLNFSGNRFKEIPRQFLELSRLQSLSMGGNRLKSIPAEIGNLTRLEMLYLGGNLISFIPQELANLRCLRYLVLCDNCIQSVPPQLYRLHSLLCLSLHNNLLTFLPREILSLVHLQELSLRGNPLVVRFVKDMTNDPPSLLELAGRTVKSRNLPYLVSDLPQNLCHYLDSASKCPNPKCAGVYFDSRVRHIKFVDFCGKFRLPLMQYLCSPECSSPCSSTPQSDAESEDESSVQADRLQKVLLG
ncbi:leucine-rich repeat-containing protein 58a isoform X2 [Tachysurus fulvidraco]|uniref:leucine-rich repeat-containing protein 58a isoform X2 n=1 Tax=Tachysurus fulvidraco TaxID=1234273 RepID=UPI001FEF0D9A|nr:leucine-rich repeat-containing protein 58a isoform X2 [Tachysurus fulvidraco]